MRRIGVAIMYQDWMEKIPVIGDIIIKEKCPYCGRKLV
jgi:hypothetical protein